MQYNIPLYIESKYHDELSRLSVIEREAALFVKTVSDIPIYIWDDDLLAGRYGWETKPEFTTRLFSRVNVFTDEETNVLAQLKEHEIIPVYSAGHTCIDYGRIVNEGLEEYSSNVRRHMEMAEAPREFLQGMLTAIEGVRLYASRFAALALEKAEKADEPERLLRMHKALKWVPMHPARDFYEALSAIWIMHSVIPMSEKCWASISLGRFDQYLYPFYQKTLQNGESREQIKSWLVNFYHLLDTYGDGACALNIGGMDADGNDQMNALSELIIEVQKELRLRAPILAVRLNPATPQRIVDSLIAPELFCVGQPTFYGELPCRRAVENRGIPTEKAKQFSINSCMGLVLAGEEIADMWGCTFNMHLPLELAVNNGNPLHKGMNLSIPKVPEHIIYPDNLNTLLMLYAHYLKSLLGYALPINRKFAISQAINQPNPLLSVLTDGCMERGQDRAVGAKYNTVTVEAHAMINTGNAIAAIDTLVFREKKYSIEELVNGAKKNYDGCEKMLADLRRCERYGTGSAYADSICRRIGGILTDICKEMSFENTLYLPSLHTLDTNVAYGSRLGATLDGRLAGTPISKNAGTAHEDVGCSPTELIISAASLGQEQFSGGQPIDVFFDYSMLASDDNRVKIRTLIETYFNLGGLQFQVNSVNPQELREAYENPAAYKNLIVRRGGYSVQFISLPRNVQADFIAAVAGGCGI